jgi:branched-chain amino acid transport system substrate-binding protein
MKTRRNNKDASQRWKHLGVVLAVIWLLVLIESGVPEAAPQPIRIGASLSLSGKYAEPSLMIQAGYKLWARQINERGGLLGRPVALTLLDDQSQEEGVKQHYRSLIEEDRVDLVLSPTARP